MSRDHFVYIY